MKKVCILLASPRKQSNSTFLANKVGDELLKQGLEISYLSLSDMDIKPCTGCDACQLSIESSCVINDQMHEVYKAMQEADTLLMAFPIYYFTVNAQLKLVLDRLYPYTSVGLAGKKIGIIATHAESGTDNAENLIKEICNYCNMKYIGCLEAMLFDKGEAEKNRSRFQADVELFITKLQA
jgi:multimeric flavodoxin WrbA